MSAERNLRPVESDVSPDETMRVVDGNGQLVGDLKGFTQALEDQVAGLQRDIRGWSTRHAELKRDKEAEAERSPVWPAAVRVFQYWREQCKHPRSEFSLDRFEMIRPFLEKRGDPKRSPDERLREAEALCKLAIDGIAHDPYVTERKNGTTKRHDGWHLIFGSADQFENRCNSAPLDRIRAVLAPPQATLGVDDPQPE